MYCILDMYQWLYHADLRLGPAYVDATWCARAAKTGSAGPRIYAVWRPLGASHSELRCPPSQQVRAIIPLEWAVVIVGHDVPILAVHIFSRHPLSAVAAAISCSCSALVSEPQECLINLGLYASTHRLLKGSQ